MKTPSLPYLLLLFCSQFMINNLFTQNETHLQRWVGLQDISYRSETDIRYVTRSGSLGGGMEYLDNHTHEISLGTYIRWNKANATYHEVHAALNSSVDKEGKIIAFGISITPELGRRITEQRLRTGYRFGVLFPWTKRLREDLGVGLSLEGVARDTAFFASTNFPRKLRQLNLGAHVYTGLEYRLHKRVKIGFHITVFSFVIQRFRHRVENPALGDDQRSTTGGTEEITAFDSVKRWRNLRVSYLLTGSTE